MGSRPVPHAMDSFSGTTATVYPPIADQWNGLLRVRFRFDDDVFQAKDFQLRSAVGWSVGGFDVGAGYDYLYSFKDSRTAEHRAFQAVEHHWFAGPLTVRNRLRLGERFVTSVDGMVARLRFRVRATQPISSTRVYIAASEEVFANLNDRGEGPVHGLEQSRLRLAAGANLVAGIRIEAGYEWHLSKGRSREDIHRRVFFIEFSGNPIRYRERVGG